MVRAKGRGAVTGVVALLAAMVAGCGAPRSLGGGGGAGGQATGGPLDLTTAAAAALCAPALGEKLTVASIPAMQQTLHRAWVLCSPLGLFRHEQAGITIGADDRWAYLAWSGGQLTAQRGLDNEGSLEYTDLSQGVGRPDIQVDFVSDLDLTIIAAPPVVSDVPRMIVLNNEGVETYTYAAIP